MLETSLSTFLRLGQRVSSHSITNVEDICARSSKDPNHYHPECLQHPHYPCVLSSQTDFQSRYFSRYLLRIGAQNAANLRDLLLIVDYHPNILLLMNSVMSLRNCWSHMQWCRLRHRPSFECMRLRGCGWEVIGIVEGDGRSSHGSSRYQS